MVSGRIYQPVKIHGKIKLQLPQNYNQNRQKGIKKKEHTEKIYSFFD